MTKRDIDEKFDAIVDFSGIGKYIDTPVKRYSSGMGVRLAFSVAAHLEPDILLIDEVLAVGDFDFQKKCLNKMEDVGLQGRTVLFVSHNMQMITRLCSRAILLEKGQIKKCLLRKTLTEIEEEIKRQCQHIRRCHNSYIVNIKQIESISGNSAGYRIILNNIDSPIPVSRKYKNIFFKQLSQ